MTTRARYRSIIAIVSTVVCVTSIVWLLLCADRLTPLVHSVENFVSGMDRSRANDVALWRASAAFDRSFIDSTDPTKLRSEVSSGDNSDVGLRASDMERARRDAAERKGAVEAERLRNAYEGRVKQGEDTMDGTFSPDFTFMGTGDEDRLADENVARLLDVEMAKRRRNARSFYTMPEST